MSLKYVFLSHQSDDKPDLAPILIALWREGIPLFVDVKSHKAFLSILSEDEAESYRNDIRIKSVGTSKDYRENIRSHLDGCILFAGFLTENVKDPGDGTAIELRYFCQAFPDEDPLLMRLKPLPPDYSVPVIEGNFLQSPETIRAIQIQPETEPVDLLRLVVDAYMKLVADDLRHDGPALQKESAARHDLPLTSSFTLKNGYEVLTLYVPSAIPHQRGFYISASPLTAMGRAFHGGLNRAQGESLKTRIPKRQNARFASREELKAAFPIRERGSLESPYPGDRNVGSLPQFRQTECFWSLSTDGTLKLTSLIPSLEFEPYKIDDGETQGFAFLCHD